MKITTIWILVGIQLIYFIFALYTMFIDKWLACGILFLGLYSGYLRDRIQNGKFINPP